MSLEAAMVGPAGAVGGPSLQVARRGKRSVWLARAKLGSA